MVLKDGGDNQITHRMSQVAKYLLSGWDVRVIARHVGCCEATAWSDIKRLREGWLREAEATFAEHRAQEIARCDMYLAAATARGDLKMCAKFCELRARLLGILGPKTAIVQPVVKIDKAAWDAIQGAADVGPPEDTIEAMLAPDPEAEARAKIPVLEARLRELNGQRGAEK
jgi:hypothetical protein